MKRASVTSRFTELTEHGVYGVERDVNLVPNLKVEKKCKVRKELTGSKWSIHIEKYAAR